MEIIVLTIYLCIFTIAIVLLIYSINRKQKNCTYTNVNTDQLYVVESLVDMIDLDGNIHRSVVAYNISDKINIVIDREYFVKNFRKTYN